MSPAGDGPGRLRLPEPARRFAGRAARLQALAPGHPLEPWLRLLARIAEGQAAAVREIPVAPLRARAEGPPLAFDRIPRDEAWRRMLDVILSAAGAPGAPGETLAAVHALAAADAAALERLAALQLAGEHPADALAAAPFVAAALEAWFGALASGVRSPEPGPAGDACPVCGAPPVGAVVDGDSRLRWLACSLCGAEWNHPRATCVACGSEAALSGFHVEGDEGAKAEACAGCRAYLKVYDLAKRPGAEPLADDAATLALDLLVAEEGYRRIGPSPWLAVAEAGTGAATPR